MYKKIALLASVAAISIAGLDAFLFINKSGKRVEVEQKTKDRYLCHKAHTLSNNEKISLPPSAFVSARELSVSDKHVLQTGPSVTLDLQNYTEDQLLSDVVVVTLNSDFKLVATGAAPKAESKQGLGAGRAMPAYLSSMSAGSAGSCQPASSQVPRARLLSAPKAESAAASAPQAPAKKSEVQQLQDELRTAELEINRLRKEVARLNKIIGDVRAAVGVV